jgi:hypothetical protein
MVVKFSEFEHCGSDCDRFGIFLILIFHVFFFCAFFECGWWGWGCYGRSFGILVDILVSLDRADYGDHSGGKINLIFHPERSWPTIFLKKN